MIDKGLMAGSTDMMILKLLFNEDMYGYQIVDELARRSQNVFALKAGTLYPLLHTMEQKGLIACYEKTHDGRVRKYYRLTDEGKGCFASKEAEWRRFAAAVESVIAKEAQYA